MKKILSLVCLLFIVNSNLNAEGIIGRIDYSTSTDIICVNGYVFVRWIKNPSMVQFFEKSNGRSVPLTCKKYMENRKKIIKAKTVLINLD
jgi:hypothetical protein